MNPYQISNIILNITFIVTFIAIFFFTYGKKIEENVVKNQSELVASYLAKDISTFIDKDTALKITSSLSIPDMTKQDQEVEENNKQLQSEAFYTLSMILIGGLLLAIIIAKYYKLNLTDILQTNLIILAFVAITQYVFLTYIGQNFISLDPNFVRHKLLISLKKSLQDNPFDSTLTLKQASKMLPEKIQELHKTHQSLQNNKESNIQPQLQQQINNVLIK